MSSEQPTEGTRLGKYQILSHVATGGMGTVYRARDEKLGRTVALKVLAPELAVRPNIVERFKREAQHAARLAHKNIVTLYEYDQAEGKHFLAMEFVEGIDLAEYIRRKGKLDPEEARRILIQAVRALDHAFQKGITHRDIKPHNFLLAEEEGKAVVKLTDLGLARNLDEEEFRVTRAGTTVGTVDYMAPEQARDSSLADVRSDIYSLGCTLYHMLAGQPPFAEGGVGERVYKHMEEEPPDIRQINPKVSAGLWAILQRMLAKKPDDRYQTPAELLHDLKSVQAVAPPPSAVGGRKRPKQPAPKPPPPEEKPAALRLVSGEQRQAAAGQFDRAQEVLASGNSDYGLKLLVSCCKLDPANLLYRQKLREAEQTAAGKKWGRWLSVLGALPVKTKLLAARRAGDHRKVLELGEEVLARNPRDVGSQLEMAESAEELGLRALAVWLLEQALHQAPKNTAVQRALAELYEKQARYRDAITMWEMVHKTDPTDVDASRKIKDLAASETIARGHYEM